MTDRLQHVTLSTPEGEHYVAVKQGRWLQIVAAFYDLDRAEQYCEVENSMVGDGEPPRPDIEKPPETPEPPSNVRVENFKAGTPKPAQIIVDPIHAAAADLAAFIDAAEEDVAEEEPAAEPEPEPAEPAVVQQEPDRPVKVAPRVKVEPLKPQPVTNGWSTARDPLLVREPEHAAAVELPKGSPGQQLADRIEADLPELMRLHFRGPIVPDLMSRYGEKEARVREATLYLVRNRKARFYLPEGEREGHLVPADFEEPAPIAHQGRPKTVDADARRSAVLTVLREEADGDLVQLSQGEIARRAKMPLGSLAPVMKSLIDGGDLEIVHPFDPITRAPVTYRICEARHD